METQLSDQIEIMTSADDNVSLELAVFAQNLADVAGEDRSIRLSVLVPDNSEATLVDRARHAVVDQIAVDRVPVAHDLIGNAPSRYLSPAAYYRVLAPELLTVRRVVHIDVDTLVRAPLDGLWNADLVGNPLAAVQNVSIPFVASRGGVRSWRKHRLDPKLPYFNSGVMVMDLDLWRSQSACSAVMAIARDGEEGFVNQGALNLHFAGRWTKLPLRWNQHPTIYDPAAGHETVFDPCDLAAAREDPAIVHFIGPTKPWHANSKHPYTEAWRDLAKEIAGPTWRPRRRDARWVVARRRLGKALNALRTG